MFCSTCMPFCLADHVLRQEAMSPPLLTIVTWIFLPPSLGCCLSLWPHSSTGSLTATARQTLPWSRAGTYWVLPPLASEEPDLIHHPQLPFSPCCCLPAQTRSTATLLLQHRTAFGDSGQLLALPQRKLGKIIFGSRQILLAVTRKVTFFSLWRLWWINSCAWENRLETRRQVRCAWDRQMETVVSICYRELSQGHNSSHWFLEGLICCW